MAAKFVQKMKGVLDKQDSPALIAPQITKLKQVVKYTDVRLDLVKHLTILLKGKSKEAPPGWMKNILRVIGCITSKENFNLAKYLNQEGPEAIESVETNYIEFKKRFSELWSEVMKWKMSPSIHKQVVILLPDRIMDHLTKPLHMSHFLLESFKMGGSVSLISLHGIFLLMQKYNFDVPDFYTKLYSMFNDEVLHSKYRARFFAYSRDFLSSTHLPEYLVGAFAKKLARLSLHAPAPAIPMVCDFITNLMIEHPGLKTLVNKKSVSQTPGTDLIMNEDPFNPDEPDPIKTHAMESCLWEMKTLQHHVLPTVALTARFISKALPKVAKDLDETLSLTSDDIYEKEVAASETLEPIPTHTIADFKNFPSSGYRHYSQWISLDSLEDSEEEEVSF